MDEIHRNTVKRLAGKYIWWKTPDEAAEMPERVIAQVMNIGDYSGVQILAAEVGDDVLRDVLAHAEAGQFSERSWVYWHMMPARRAESDMLARCVAVARGAVPVARDQQEANVFRLAALVVQSRFPGESASLMNASERYFMQHPGDKLAPAEVVRNGWVFSLPRLRDMLSLQLQRE